MKLNKEPKQKRFEIIEEEKLDNLLNLYIIVDKTTGILYLLIGYGRKVSTTVLLDENGNPSKWHKQK